MRQSIIILEDNLDRISAMQRCISDKFPFFELHVCRTAAAAIRCLTECLPNVICISLDHDLEPLTTDDDDPGTGRVVADFLASVHPACPVILYTTNRLAADSMEMVLTDSGWHVDRLMPYDDCRWISEAWLPMLRSAIVAAAAPDLVR